MAALGFQEKRERIREKMRIDVGMNSKNEETTCNVRREIEIKWEIWILSENIKREKKRFESKTSVNLKEGL